MSSENVERDIEIDAHYEGPDQVAAYAADDKDTEEPDNVVRCRMDWRNRDLQFVACPEAHPITDPSKKECSDQVRQAVHESRPSLEPFAVRIGEENQTGQQ